jgi:hypothetical protein
MVVHPNNPNFPLRHCLKWFICHAMVVAAGLARGPSRARVWCIAQEKSRIQCPAGLDDSGVRYCRVEMKKASEEALLHRVWPTGYIST